MKHPFNKLILVSLAALAMALPVFAQQASPSAETADGEIRKVDKDNKKLTLKHGPLRHLDMPSMTMVFQVKDGALLDKVKAGDKVRFQAEKIDGKYTVTQIEATR